jgi:hypothetical protein
VAGDLVRKLKVLDIVLAEVYHSYRQTPILSTWAFTADMLFRTLPYYLVLSIQNVEGAFNLLTGFDSMVQYNLGISTNCMTAM